MDLAFATTAELVRELMGRTTFVGAIIHSQNQHRSADQIHGDFQITTNLRYENLLSMLGRVMMNLETQNYEERTE